MRERVQKNTRRAPVFAPIKHVCLSGLQPARAACRAKPAGRMQQQVRRAAKSWEAATAVQRKKLRPPQHACVASDGHTSRACCGRRNGDHVQLSRVRMHAARRNIFKRRSDPVLQAHPTVCASTAAKTSGSSAACLLLRWAALAVPRGTHNSTAAHVGCNQARPRPRPAPSTHTNRHTQQSESCSCCVAAHVVRARLA